MTSVLKVDSIQTSSGATPRIADVGINNVGTVVKTTVFPTIKPMTVTHSAGYNSNRANYRDLGSSYYQTVTLQTNNPILLITGAIGSYPSGGSHSYFDMAYDKDGTEYWLSQQIAGATTVDAIAASYQSGNAPNWPFAVHAAYQTSYAAGTSLTFKPHVSSWSTGTIYINSYPSSGNRNQDMVTTFICQEIAT